MTILHAKCCFRATCWIQAPEAAYLLKISSHCFQPLEIRILARVCEIIAMGNRLHICQNDRNCSCYNCPLWNPTSLETIALRLGNSQQHQAYHTNCYRIVRTCFPASTLFSISCFRSPMHIGLWTVVSKAALGISFIIMHCFNLRLRPVAASITMSSKTFNGIIIANHAAAAVLPLLYSFALNLMRTCVLNRSTVKYQSIMSLRSCFLSV